jgi:hypothetical protein
MRDRKEVIERVSRSRNVKKVRLRSLYESCRMATLTEFTTKLRDKVFSGGHAILVIRNADRPSFASASGRRRQGVIAFTHCPYKQPILYLSCYIRHFYQRVSSL